MDDVRKEIIERGGTATVCVREKIGAVVDAGAAAALFSSIPRPTGPSRGGGRGGGDTRDDSAEIFFQSFSSGGHCEQFWHGQGLLTP